MKYICEKCGKEFERKYKFRLDRHIHCNDCKLQAPHYTDVSYFDNILDVSKRTISKILIRIGANKCSICGWNESTCDIHHIIPKSKGGSNDDSNLIIVCPNCHRIIHSNKIYDESFLNTINVAKLYPNWKDGYNMPNYIKHGVDNANYGTCYITKDGKNLQIKKEEFEKYSIDGWKIGRTNIFSNEQKIEFSDKSTEWNLKHPFSVFKNGINKRVTNEEFDILILDGWTRGVDFSKEARDSISQKLKEYKWIKKENVVKRVKNSELEKYLNDKWKLGR